MNPVFMISSNFSFFLDHFQRTEPQTTVVDEEEGDDEEEHEE